MRKSAVGYYQSTVPSRTGGRIQSANFLISTSAGHGRVETAEQHNGRAAFLSAHPRHDTDLREKYERWAVILLDWIQGRSIIDTVVDRVNPTLRLHLALLGLELLLWLDEGSEEESAVLNRLCIGFDESCGNWADFSTILGESVMVREAIMALLTSASDPRRQESQVEILKACCTTIDALYNWDAMGYSRQN